MAGQVKLENEELLDIILLYEIDMVVFQLNMTTSDTDVVFFKDGLVNKTRNGRSLGEFDRVRDKLILDGWRYSIVKRLRFFVKPR